MRSKKKSGLDFGEALRELKAGKAVARKGWNGKKMHIYLEDSFLTPIRSGIYRGTARSFEPVISHVHR